MGRKTKQESRLDAATQNFLEAKKIISEHPLFAPLMFHAYIHRSESAQYPKDGYATVTLDGYILVHPKRYEEVEVWVYVLAHCLLHLGFGHFKKKQRQDLWNIACDLYIAKFLDDFRLGKPPRDSSYVIRDLKFDCEEKLYQEFLINGIDQKLLEFGTGNLGQGDMSFDTGRFFFANSAPEWEKLFGSGLRAAVTSAVNVASGYQDNLATNKLVNTDAQRARSWFIASYPLLGSLASTFELIEDLEICRQLNVSVAAVDMEMQEIYINPTAALSEEECKFVIAHELLHVGLRHDTRRQGRDPFLWNVACDFVINAWLVEMQIGAMPAIGTLFDPTLKVESAESVYDTITTDLRRMRKLATFRGQGGCDIIDSRVLDASTNSTNNDLDSFYRSCLMQGLEYHNEQGRGFLPAGLVEEVKALAHPPIPWDVELAKWFDGHFTPLEKTRSYSRPSRRQSGSPDIPRPKYVPLLEAQENRAFGIVLDTSGSMDRNLLARGLGAITSYSLSREISQVRLVFCDAATYDQGYISPEELYERVKIKGRGGTTLQPGIDLLQKAENFPRSGPILIITDGGCDKLSIKREHAYLVPASGRLPFQPKGRVFRLR